MRYGVYEFYLGSIIFTGRHHSLLCRCPDFATRKASDGLSVCLSVCLSACVDDTMCQK